ncbi:SanA/YdcF family protein [Riemerella columbina]|uniref:SanA/YdcF family protein n=1 Tax=Riemerella columbina TaxID=103810 RepID=UPI003CCC2AF0
MKTFGILFLIFILLSGLALWLSNLIIEQNSKAYISYDISQLPNKKVGLVLGTSRNLTNGNINLFFKNRIEAAAELYRSGKVKYLIVSGDNSQKDYNETQDMKLDLIAMGIPEDHIFEDFAGFRTLDSVVRVEDIFGQQSFIIISQKFHNERAVYLARQHGLEAYGYNAKEVYMKISPKTYIREYFARVKVFFDLLFGVEPKFSGEKVNIP